MTRLTARYRNHIQQRLNALATNALAHQAVKRMIFEAAVAALPKLHRKLVDAGFGHHLADSWYSVARVAVCAPAGADPEALAADKALAARVRRRYPERMRGSYHHTARQHWLQRLAAHTTVAKLRTEHPELGRCWMTSCGAVLTGPSSGASSTPLGGRFREIPLDTVTNTL